MTSYYIVSISSLSCNNITHPSFLFNCWHFCPLGQDTLILITRGWFLVMFMFLDDVLNDLVLERVHGLAKVTFVLLSKEMVSGGVEEQRRGVWALVVAPATLELIF